MFASGYFEIQNYRGCLNTKLAKFKEDLEIYIFLCDRAFRVLNQSQFKDL